MHKKYIGFALCLLTACSDPAELPDTEPVADLAKEVTIKVDKQFQTMEGFAASDCWVPNYVGTYWSDTEKESIAKLLFSQSVANGKPEGIGLSMWRFNLGGGTAEQGDASGIADRTRRAECFLNADGSYNWDRQAGQQYFLQKAKQYGCERFVMFSNTPPVYYTQNGKGYSSSGSFSNLKGDSYGAYASYITRVLTYFKEQKGIDFALVSPVNEPQYNWGDPSQEGSGWKNAEIKQLAGQLDASLTSSGLSTKQLLPEAADWNYLVSVKGDADRSNQLDDFFSNGSANYLGDLPSVAKVAAGHSYWTDGSFAEMQQIRQSVQAKAAAHSLQVYQTEWSMLGDYYNENYPGHDKAGYMDIALYMAKVIHADMVYASASSWSFWTSMDLERWGHKSRFLLISVTPADGVYGDIRNSGTHESRKNLWVLGNYSLFVRPGFKRVSLDIANASSLFMGSAYVAPDGKRLVAVYTNISDKRIAVNTALSGVSGKTVSSVKMYTTSQTSDLQEEVVAGASADKQLVIPARAVVTIVYDFNN